MEVNRGGNEIREEERSFSRELLREDHRIKIYSVLHTKNFDIN